MRHHTKINLLTSVLVSLVMSVFFSGFFSLLNLGFSAEWVGAWVRGTAIAWPIATVVSFYISGPLRQIALRIVGPESGS